MFGCFSQNKKKKIRERLKPFSPLWKAPFDLLIFVAVVLVTWNSDAYALSPQSYLITDVLLYKTLLNLFTQKDTNNTSTNDDFYYLISKGIFLFISHMNKKNELRKWTSNIKQKLKKNANFFENKKGNSLTQRNFVSSNCALSLPSAALSLFFRWLRLLYFNLFKILKIEVWRAYNVI